MNWRNKFNVLLIFFCLFLLCNQSKAERFPDGKTIDTWFSDTTMLDPSTLGRFYVISDYGAVGDGKTLNTSIIQKVINLAADSGGGVIVIPQGRFLTGALFFKPGTHLHVRKKGVLLGADQIKNFPIGPSRIEGQSIDYFPAVVNAYGVDGFSISGEGTIDGNGLNYWKAFWQRRKENPRCTNLEVSRPRLIFIRDSKNVCLQQVHLQNSGFWTTHIYKCSRIKILGVSITSPVKPVKAPSTDAIDLDVCSDVLIDGCYLSVNDDAIALKGGKGPLANKNPDDGPNRDIIIQNCHFGFCHSAVTCGSESIHDRNLIVRNCLVDGAGRVLRLKNRPDTPQLYEYILVEGIHGSADRLLDANPWRQFFNLHGREHLLLSESDHISFRNIDLKCKIFVDVNVTDDDRLKNFSFENMTITATNGLLDPRLFDGIQLKNVQVNGKQLTADNK